MFGEDYFKTRKRLTDVVLQVLELAERTGAEKESLLENDITKGLSNPFLWAITSGGHSIIFYSRPFYQSQA